VTFVFRRKWMSIFIFVSFSAVNWISFSSAFSFTAENDKCFSVGLYYTSQKGLGLDLGLEKSLYITAKGGLEAEPSAGSTPGSKLETRPTPTPNKTHRICMHQSQEHPLPKVGWTCPPPSPPCGDAPACWWCVADVRWYQQGRPCVRACVASYCDRLGYT